MLVIRVLDRRKNLQIQTQRQRVNGENRPIYGGSQPSQRKSEWIGTRMGKLGGKELLCALCFLHLSTCRLVEELSEVTMKRETQTSITLDERASSCVSVRNANVFLFPALRWTYRLS